MTPEDDELVAILTALDAVLDDSSQPQPSKWRLAEDFQEPDWQELRSS